MIECKPYKASFLLPNTCIKNQQAIDKFKKEKNRINGHEIMQKALPDEYYTIRACDGCKVGTKLYDDYKKGKIEMSKVVKTKVCKTENEHKPEPQRCCALESCGKPLVRGPEETEAGWRNRKYCPECARKAERIRDNARKRKLRRNRQFDTDAAKKISSGVTDQVMELFAPFLINMDAVTPDQVKAIALEVGVRCQREAVREL